MIDMRILWVNKALELMANIKESGSENDPEMINRLDNIVKTIKELSV